MACNTNMITSNNGIDMEDILLQNKDEIHKIRENYPIYEKITKEVYDWISENVENKNVETSNIKDNNQKKQLRNSLNNFSSQCNGNIVYI
jgi:hypothetical protein